MSCNVAVLFTVTFLPVVLVLIFFPSSFSEIIHFPADSLRGHLVLSIYLVNKGTNIGEVVGDCNFTLSESVPFLQTDLYYQVQLSTKYFQIAY